MKKTIFTEEDKKRLYKIVINNQNIDIYKRTYGTNKYRRIDFKINNYDRIYFGYNPINLKKYKNDILHTEHIGYRFKYELNNNSIRSILIQLSSNPYKYISIFDEVHLFMINEPIINYELFHNICNNINFVNKYIIQSTPLLTTSNHTYNLDKNLYILNTNININKNLYLLTSNLSEDNKLKIFQENNINFTEIMIDELLINELFLEVISYDNSTDNTEDDSYNDLIDYFMNELSDFSDN